MRLGSARRRASASMSIGRAVRSRCVGRDKPRLVGVPAVRARARTSFERTDQGRPRGSDLCPRKEADSLALRASTAGHPGLGWLLIYLGAWHEVSVMLQDVLERAERDLRLQAKRQGSHE
jgi:hypothetical protein